MRRSTRPVALWSCAGAFIGSILFSKQFSSIFLPVKHLASSNLIVLGTPEFNMYVFRILIIIGLEALFTISIVG